MQYDIEGTEEVSKELKEYIETNIFPKYESVDEGHRMSHISKVIEKSMKFAKECGDKSIDLDMVYAIAAYHDVGLSVADRSVHEKASAQIMLNDKFLEKFFGEDKVDIMAMAVEDHRASLKGEPRNIYGKFVSQADRDNNPMYFLKRAYLCLKNKPPYSRDFESLKSDVRTHLSDKYGPNGYALGKIWFKDDDFEAFKTKINEYLEDDDKLVSALKSIIQKDDPSALSNYSNYSNMFSKYKVNDIRPTMEVKV